VHWASNSTFLTISLVVSLHPSTDMPERDMTPDERKRFEEGVLHQDDQRKDEGGPASDPEVRDDQRKPKGPVLPPNPD
jgi:hypothetical protein